METWLAYLLPVLAFALLAAGWMALQLMASRSGIRNHIDNGESCCGACEERDNCSKSESAGKCIREGEESLQQG